MPKNNLNKLLKLFLFSILISLCSLSLALAPNPIRIEAEDYFLLQGADLGASFDEEQERTLPMDKFGWFYKVSLAWLAWLAWLETGE